MIILTPNKNEITGNDTLNTLTSKTLTEQGITHELALNEYMQNIYIINGKNYKISDKSTFARIELISEEEYNKTEIEIDTNNNTQVKAHFTPYNETSTQYINARTQAQARQEFYKEHNKSDINLFYVCLV